MSHVQLLRAIFQVLADPGTFSQGIFMQWGDAGQGSPKAAAPSQQAMRKAFDVVFVDSSGWCNLAAHVTKSALKQVSHSSIPFDLRFNMDGELMHEGNSRTAPPACCI